MLGKMYHNGCVHHIVGGDDLEWFPRTHNPGSFRQLLYRCTCCTCCTGTLGTAGTAAVQHTHLGQQLLYAVPAVPLYLLYRCTAVPAVPPGLRRKHLVPRHPHLDMLDLDTSTLLVVAAMEMRAAWPRRFRLRARAALQ